MSDQLKKRKILIVEDDQSLLQMYSDKLKQEGFNVVFARNGEEGLALSASEIPDLILLDILLPKMDGLSMLDNLRTNSEWGKNVPVIILTNLDADDQVIAKVIADKPSYYLMKANTNPQGVSEKIKEILH